MKKWFVQVEYVFITLIIIGLALRLAQIGPSDVFIMIGFLGQAFWYLYLGVAGGKGLPAGLVPFHLESPLSKIETFTLLVIGNSLSVSLIGILFQVVKWEGGYFMVMVGAISAVVGLLASYFVLRMNRAEIYNFIFFRQLPITFMVLVMLYLGDTFSAF